MKSANAMKAEECLRSEMLCVGLDDWVSMAEVQGMVKRLNLAENDSDWQQLVMRTVRRVLNEGLMQIGELPSPGEEFQAWEGPVDLLMQRLGDLYIRHFEEPSRWDYSVWLDLTKSGQRAAEALQARPS